MDRTRSLRNPESPVSIHWFRRDLRLRDNPALAAAAENGRVLPVFILDPGDDSGTASRWWLDRSLRALARSLEDAGAPLVIRRGDPAEVLPALARECGAVRIFWNRLYEPGTVSRDLELKESLRAEGMDVRTFNGSLLYEPWTVEKGTGGPFKIFTPFWRKARLAEPDLPAGKIRRLLPVQPPPRGESVDALRLSPRTRPTSGLEAAWTPGEAGATAAFARFLKEVGGEYRSGRDVPGIAGTSRLSPFLHFGEISPHRVWWDHLRKGPAPELQDGFLNELGWREFGHHILFHFPRTVSAPLDSRFDDFPWRRSARDEASWRKGLTGFPIVDAGMRELWETGWMHNRVRMIAASFFVKHLGLDWRSGARWFWDTLVDADLAANTMGWQWSAGCGADAAPYFRVFNPILQGEKFDRDGRYVRRWLPELAAVPERLLHRPWESSAETPGYPRPVVEHSAGRARALGLYERWRGPKRVRP